MSSLVGAGLGVDVLLLSFIVVVVIVMECCCCYCSCCCCLLLLLLWAPQANFFFQAEDGIRDPLWSRGLGDVYKRQQQHVYS